VLTGLGIADPPPRERMFNLELTQRWLMNRALQEAIPDPEAAVAPSPTALRTFIEAVIEDKQGTSQVLRSHLERRYQLILASSGQRAPSVAATVLATKSAPPNPPFRRLRIYALDPSFSTRLDTASINEVALRIPWEPVGPGPTGEYLEVVDANPSAPNRLDEPRLLGQDGWAPAEGNLGFHQQMVYAVAMSTISRFERALGRPVLWRNKPIPSDPFDDSGYVRRLRVDPHALRQANAFYSQQDIALRFGYFDAEADDPGDHVPGSKVYTCLSHDIVAHETTHAILDGMHRRFIEPTNPDVLAFHEGFADIVALMQHFTIREILESQIGRTRGNLESESVLGSLAVQFGRATGGRGALRDAIGRFDDKGVWIRNKPDPSDLRKLMTPHARGAILVAAVFDAFLAIYRTRTADLVRLATSGTGILPSGAIHPDLVRRLADEASKSAQHTLDMCIRALDYVPPVDITFGEYLRGIITADFDLVPEDRYDYRVAFVEAFRRRGIYPDDLETLSVETLRWEGLDLPGAAQYRAILDQLRRYADECTYIEDRKALFEKTRARRRELHDALEKIFMQAAASKSALGLDPALSFEVHHLRRAIRTTPDGRYVPQIICALTQSRDITVDGTTAPYAFRGGSMLIVDLRKPEIQYKISKRVDNQERERRTKEFLATTQADPWRALLIAGGTHEPFAALHLLADVGGL